MWDCEALPHGGRKGQISWPKREAKELNCFHSCWLLAHVKKNPDHQNKVGWITEAPMLEKPFHSVSYSLEHLFHIPAYPETAGRHCKAFCNNHYKLVISDHINSYLPINYSLNNSLPQTNWCEPIVCFWIYFLMKSSWFKTFHHYKNSCTYSKCQK